MNGIRAWAAAAAVMTCVPVTPSEASDAHLVVAFFNQEKTGEAPETTGSIPKGRLANPEGFSSKRGGGSIEKQIASVSIGCLKPELTSLIRQASSHFGSAAVITSGYRPGRGSYHGRCMAADVQISGVAPGALARYFRSLPGVGGVGTYGHTRSVHVDVAPRQYTWHHGRRKRYAALGCPCCSGLASSGRPALARACAPSGSFAGIKLGAARA